MFGVNQKPLGSRHPLSVSIAASWLVTTAAVKAELDMGTVNAQLDNVLEATTAGAAGNSITVAVVGDSATGAGVTITRSGTDFTIHFESGVSTQGHVNTAIGLLSGADDLIGVKTAGTTGTVLVSGRALLDMDTSWGDPDSVIQAGFNTGVGGNAYAISTVDDGTGAGTLEVLDMGAGKILVYHFEGGVSTVGDFEAAVAALSPADFEVLTAGTALNTFSGAADCLTHTLASGTATHAEQAAASLTGGAAEGAVTSWSGGKEIASIAHTSAGLYTVTLRDAYPKLLDAVATLQDASAEAYSCGIGSYDGSAKTVQVRVVGLAAGAVADPTPAAGKRINLSLTMANTGTDRLPAA
jgi:hypothetical protein